MAVTIANLNIKLGATSGALRKGLQKGGDSVNRFGKKLGKGTTIGRAFNGIMGKMPGGLGAIATAAGPVGIALAVITAAAAAAALALRKTLQQFGEIDKIGKFAQRIGIGSEQLVGLRLAAELTGAGADNLQLGLQRMTRRVTEAAQGTGEARAAIKELGLDAVKLAQLAPDQQFSKIADAMQGVATEGDKVRLTFKLFDSEGVALKNTLELGSAGLADVTQQARELGIAFSEVDKKKIEDANNAIGLMNAAFTGLFRQFAIDIAPAVGALAEFATEVIIATAGLIKAFGPEIRGVIRLATLTLQGFAIGMRSASQFTRNFLSTITVGGIASTARMQEINAEAAKLAASKGLSKTAEDAQAAANAFAALAKGSDGASASVSNLVSIGARLSNELKTPREKSNDRLAELDKALNAGTITVEIFQRGLQKVGQKLNSITASEILLAKGFNENIVGIGKKFTDEFKTPAEQAKERIIELRDALNAGVVSQETYARGFKSIAGDLAEARKEQVKLNDLQRSGIGAGAAVRGRTAAGTAALFALRSQLQSSKLKGEEAAKEQAAAAERQATATEEMQRILEVAPIVRSTRI